MFGSRDVLDRAPAGVLHQLQDHVDLVARFLDDDLRLAVVNLPALRELDGQPEIGMQEGVAPHDAVRRVVAGTRRPSNPPQVGVEIDDPLGVGGGPPDLPEPFPATAGRDPPAGGVRQPVRHAAPIGRPWIRPSVDRNSATAEGLPPGLRRVLGAPADPAFALVVPAVPEEQNAETRLARSVKGRRTREDAAKEHPRPTLVERV